MTDPSGATTPGFSIRPAEWPADEAVAQQLLRNYAAYLAGTPANICIDHLDEVLTTLPQTWSEPDGVLLLGFFGAVPAGCVAIKVRHDRPGACEMKRLWVESHARGHRAGRALAQAAIEWSRSHGADTLLLDTLPEAMPEAAALYLSLGFTETERHNSNPVAGLRFLQLRLR